MHKIPYPSKPSILDGEKRARLHRRILRHLRLYSVDMVAIDFFGPGYNTDPYDKTFTNSIDRPSAGIANLASSHNG